MIVRDGPACFATLSHPIDVEDREPTLPSMTALRTMVLVEKFGSFSRAAEELGITQSGVSRAIRSIEQITGQRIFERSARGLSTTESGKRYLAEVREILGELGAATLRFSSFDSAVTTLHVATLPSLGSLWLAPRLADFARKNPQISLIIAENIGVIDFEASSIDCVIHYGSTAWPQGARSEVLLRESLMPFAPPALLQGRASDASTLLDVPLIQHAHRPTAWRDWFREVGIVHPGPTTGHRFEQYQMGIRAAAGGLGAVLMPPFLVEDEVAKGRLVPLHGKPIETAWTFQLVSPDTKRQNPAVRRFRTWLVGEIRAMSRPRSP
jgi:LysR family transcriptional regulator, glycine cleavage system transcriptional activator